MKYALVLDLHRFTTGRVMRFVLFCVALFLLGVLAGMHLQKIKVVEHEKLMWKNFSSQPSHAR